MRKYILATLFLGLFVLFLEPAEKLLSNFLRLEQPTVHKIENGDWLSKIALEYYGDPSYWKELELINRAPEGNLIFPGEKIIVPSFTVIQKIRHSRKLSAVNELVKEQQNLLAKGSFSEYELLESAETRGEETQSETTAELSEPVVADNSEPPSGASPELNSSKKQASVANNMLLLGGILVGLTFVLGIIFFIRSRRKEETSYYGADMTEPDSESEKSVYLDEFDTDVREREKETNEKQFEPA